MQTNWQNSEYVQKLAGMKMVQLRAELAELRKGKGGPIGWSKDEIIKNIEAELPEETTSDERSKVYPISVLNEFDKDVRKVVFNTVHFKRIWYQFKTTNPTFRDFYDRISRQYERAKVLLDNKVPDQITVFFQDTENEFSKELILKRSIGTEYFEYVEGESVDALFDMFMERLLELGTGQTEGSD